MARHLNFSDERLINSNYSCRAGACKARSDSPGTPKLGDAGKLTSGDNEDNRHDGDQDGAS